MLRQDGWVCGQPLHRGIFKPRLCVYDVAEGGGDRPRSPTRAVKSESTVCAKLVGTYWRVKCNGQLIVHNPESHRVPLVIQGVGSGYRGVVGVPPLSRGLRLLKRHGYPLRLSRRHGPLATRVGQKVAGSNIYTCGGPARLRTGPRPRVPPPGRRARRGPTPAPPRYAIMRPRATRSCAPALRDHAPPRYAIMRPRATRSCAPATRGRATRNA